jgi:Holliday junction resolvase
MVEKNPNELLEVSDTLSKYKSRKKAVNSRRKGSNFERKLATQLNSTFECTEFARTPGSGAFATTHSLPEHLQIHGDLITPQNFKYVIEAKCGYNVDLDDLFRKNSELHKFIRQAKKESKAAKKPWFLIYKKTRKDTLLISEVNFNVTSRIEVTLDRTFYVYKWDDVLGLDKSHFFE